jgi:hypothetical protein
MMVAFMLLNFLLDLMQEHGVLNRILLIYDH